MFVKKIANIDVNVQFFGVFLLMYVFMNFVIFVVGVNTTNFLVEGQ